MKRNPHSRRDYLTALGTTGAAIGGGSLALSSASAQKDPTGTESDVSDGGDAADVRLVPKCVDERRDAAVFHAVNDGSEPVTLEWRRVSSREAIQFVDCRTVRVVGDFDDVLVDARFVADDGGIGNVIEPIGSVDGERTFSVDEIDNVPDDTVIATVEAFVDGPLVLGTGDVAASNPEYETCRSEFLEESDGGAESGDTDGGAESGDADDGTESDQTDDGSAPGDADSGTELEESIEFLDCQRVRVVGDFADVGIDATFVAADGGIGNVIEFFGPVDGERVIDIEESDTVPDDAIAVHADAFAEGAARLPYDGDVSASNPDYDACQREVFGEIVDGPSHSSTDGNATAGGNATADGNATAETRTASSVQLDESDADDRGELTVPARSETSFAVTAPDGDVTVELRADGERIDVADSVAGSPCFLPIVPWVFNTVTLGWRS